MLRKKGPVTRLKEAYLEILSDYENYTARKEKELEELRSLSALPLLKNLFPVLDDFERAMKELANNDGVRLIYTQLKKVLNDYGVEEYSLLGMDFDPQLAEAVDFVIKEDAKPLIVVEELAKGYSFRGRVIRPARVIVNKGCEK